MAEFTPVLRKDIPEESLEPLQLDPLVKQLDEAQTLLRGLANWCIGVIKPDAPVPHMRPLAMTLVDSRADWEYSYDESYRFEPRLLWWSGPSEYRLLIRSTYSAGVLYNSHARTDPAINADLMHTRELGQAERDTILDHFNGLRVLNGYVKRQLDEFSDEFEQGRRSLIIARPIKVTLPVERRTLTGEYSHSGNVRIPPRALIEPLDAAHHVLLDPQP